MSSDEKTIIFDTGNIFKFGILQRKVLQDPNVEVLEGLESLFDSYSSQLAKWKTVKFETNDQQLELKCLQVDEQDNLIQNHDRSKLKLSIKLFLFPEVFDKPDEYKNFLIEESITAICKILNINQIDNLILSIQINDVDQVIPNLKSFWPFCENFVTTEKVRSLGTSDLNYNQLVDFHNSVFSVKPSLTQINLDACCDIPADLSSFSKENSIQLFTHNDPADDFLPIERMKELFRSKNASCPIEETNYLKRKWIARYTFVLPGQGVVLSKGYLISLFFEIL